MKTASKVFIIISIVIGSIYALVGFVFLFNPLSAAYGVVSIIFCAVLLIVGFNALGKLEDARSHEDLIAIGILTIIFCSFLGGLFMLLIKDEELNSRSHSIHVTPAPKPVAPEPKPMEPEPKPATSNSDKTETNTVKSYAEEEDKVCSTCGEKLEEGQNFCGVCGTPVHNICPECNTINKSHDVFCRNCGNKLKEI